jgi:organic hydroperoxide reductase OsmC/OhrA
MTIYSAQTIWSRGETSPADFLAGRYHRRHVLRFDGGAEVPGSASTHNVRGPYTDPFAVDPEEAFVSALSSCHMLFVLWFAQRRGWCIDCYVDQAEGELAEDDAGRRAMTVVTLRPKIDFSGDKRPDEAELEQLHHDAHQACFIANSVKSDVRVEARSS